MPITCTPTTCCSRAGSSSPASSSRSHRTASGARRWPGCAVCAASTLTALGLCAEIGDWNRFDHRDSIAKYVGLVPSEHSSGQTRRLGKITKAGSTHARRLLVEAALHYRLTPAVGGKLAIRQRGQDPALIDHAWRVQRRLHARWQLLRESRGKPAGVVTIAIARELIGACWEIATTT